MRATKTGRATTARPVPSPCRGMHDAKPPRLYPLLVQPSPHRAATPCRRYAVQDGRWCAGDIRLDSGIHRRRARLCLRLESHPRETSPAQPAGARADAAQGQSHSGEPRWGWIRKGGGRYRPPPCCKCYPYAAASCDQSISPASPASRTVSAGLLVLMVATSSWAATASWKAIWLVTPCRCWRK